MDGSYSDNVRKKKRYRQFNEKFYLKISIEFQVRDQFRDTHVFKRALKTLAVQQEFDYIYKHNDTSRVSAIYRQNIATGGFMLLQMLLRLILKSKLMWYF
jgi:hypothetical protein